MAANTRDNSSGSSKYKPRQERFSVQRSLELLGLIDGDNSDLEDLSDNDDPILDANYQPPPQEQSSSEDDDDSSDDEDPIPQPTESGDPLNTSVDEVYHFFGACIWMSCIRYPTIRMYWSKALRITAITDRFTHNRFFRLRGSIQVLIDDDVPGRGTGGLEADDIVLDFDLYQGKGALLEQVEEEEVGLGLGGLVLARLSQTLHRGTKVYCDRFFTRFRGVEQMMKKEMYITGTIMKNRLAGAKEKLPFDKTMKNTRREPEDTCQRWDKKLKQYVTVSRPSIVREYNLKMGGVDLIDRMISYYRMSARTKKWTMRMLMHFTDLALDRKDFAICAAPKRSIMQFLEFRTEMATTLLAQHHGQGSDADLSEQSEEEDNSNQGKKRPVTAVPYVLVRRRANADDQPEERGALQGSRLHWKNPSALCDLQSVLVLARRSQLLHSLSHIL
ncbi:hypothetical protein JOQ06_020296 [Pogonophryne albipinna]|uniref:PiggyBac transposable element-derived protein domain-containing protein n=1 Tax=Pogonophryne albipinna TaxID=1090488 RepID=A0AAD6BQ55_9TELE|nr:hypothetical protein JOQ06_020296 [Pogonophryne albipinna]